MAHKRITLHEPRHELAESRLRIDSVTRAIFCARAQQLFSIDQQHSQIA